MTGVSPFLPVTPGGVRRFRGTPPADDLALCLALRIDTGPLGWRILLVPALDADQRERPTR